MNKGFYTYVHRRNDTGEVFYVGKGSGKRAWSDRHRTPYWHSIVGKCGHTVEILSTGLPEREAHRQEVRLIKLFSREHLANMTDGGEGVMGHVHSEATRAKIAAALRGKVLPDSTKKKLSAALKGRYISPETRAKISLAHTGMKRPRDAVEKMAATKRGVPQNAEWVAARVAGRAGYAHSEATKKKISEGNRGRVRSESANKRNAETHRGKKQSAETVEKRVAHFRKPVIGGTREFPSATDAAMWLRANGYPKASGSSICEACTGKRKTAYDRVWRYL